MMASHNYDPNSSNFIADTQQLHPYLFEMVRLSYTKDSFYGDRDEWTKGGQIVARDASF
jgi:hypothetical protein